MAQWNEKLNEKRDHEIQAEKDARATAASEYSQWKQQRDIRLNAKRDSNRNQEAGVIESLNVDVDAGNTWERVSKLIDAGSEPVNDSKKADVSRMRKLFIQLKNEAVY